MFQEKIKEVNDLKGELEKYKMSEKLATSILDSPCDYSNSSQAIRRRRNQSSNSSFALQQAQTPLGLFSAN